MKRIIFLFLIVSIFFDLYSSHLELVVEKTKYKNTSTYGDVMDFLFHAQKKSDLINIIKLTTSTEGRMIPLVVLSKEGVKDPREMKIVGKPAVLIMANIHAGEVEGKEATLMLIRDIVRGKEVEKLENQILLILPIFNADGNEKIGNNRNDNGPELAGVRHNGQFLDLNRDYLKLESPEIRGLINLFNTWDPILVVDMHTTNGSYHREPVTYTTNVNPNSNLKLSAYLWENLFPSVARILKEKYNYDSLPYGNFVDRTKPEKGWRNHGFYSRFGNNYMGFRNRFCILDENYAHADFETRVLSSYCFIKSILLYTDSHIEEMKKMVDIADRETRNNYSQEDFVLEFENKKLFDVTVKSYEFILEKINPQHRDQYPYWVKDYFVKKTDVLKDYKLTYFSKAAPKRSISIPEAYILLPNHKNAIANLKHHGIIIEKIKESIQSKVEFFDISEIKPDQQLYQGHVMIQLKGTYEEQLITIPKDSYFISMHQPLARLIPILLEPESQDSLVAWGYFNKELIAQWSGKPRQYPIYRLHQKDIPFEMYQD